MLMIPMFVIIKVVRIIDVASEIADVVVWSLENADELHDVVVLELAALQRIHQFKAELR